MREINTSVQISSKPEKVWEILANFPEWPKWNPIVNKIEGNQEVGAVLSITMCDKVGKAGMKYKANITSFEKNRRFSFIGKMMAGFLFTADRIIELEKSSDGTLFSQKEIYTGLLVPLFWNKMNTQATKMLNSMNTALKKISET